MKKEVGTNRDSGDIHCEEMILQDFGDFDEEVESQAVRNPYYDGSIDLCAQNTKKAQKIPDLNDTEVVTATQNIYYDL